MVWSYPTSAKKDTRHRVFISYYHYDDEHWRDRFAYLFSHIFMNTSVNPGDIDPDLSDEYIKALIQKNYISDASVLIVLVGSKTYCRKHVDWEISAALMKKVGKYSGLLGLLLPTYPGYERNEYDPGTIPPRLLDNVGSGYAELHRWTEDEARVRSFIEEAFNNRIKKADLIANSRQQFRNNRGG